MALHLSEQPNPNPGAEQAETAGRCRPGIHVSNIDEFHQKMVQLNVRCLQEPKSVLGTKIAQYIDPDGLTISVGEAKR